ncbi:Ribosome biogenesis protein SLX9 [Rhizoctonia solani]|uniref:Ribosome biogenesis protein SLX9 n=1 Tax=Rhizoctonia solani TaxID=456999 RepID=A0A8H7LFG9_9AGAM|nr:Ribosome biogenesis protein SLX9 [Rhizoctonia solani]
MRLGWPSQKIEGVNFHSDTSLQQRRRHEYLLSQKIRLNGFTERIFRSFPWVAANELLSAAITQPTNAPKALTHIPTKKEKKQAKHERLIQRLAAGASPYSKSHNRRVKRKQKTALSTDLQSVQDALNTIAENILTPASETNTNNAGNSPVRPKQAHDMIGKGKGATLTKQQRKRALELERLRQPAIITNSDYRQNPFDAIRRHAQNSLLSHENGKA